MPLIEDVIRFGSGSGRRQRLQVQQPEPPVFSLALVAAVLWGR